MIEQKRNELVLFIEEQMSGPGACGLRYFSSKVDKDCLPDRPSLYFSEVINTTPGSLYSTGILFPQRESIQFQQAKTQDDEEISLDEVIEDEDNFNDNGNSDIEDKGDSYADSEDEDVFSLSQRFPNTIGLSFCLSSDFNDRLKNDLKIIISGRYYKEINKESNKDIYVRIEDKSDEFGFFYSTLDDEFKGIFKLSDGYLSANHNISSKVYQEYVNKLKELNRQKAKEIATLENGDLDPIFCETKKEEHRYLKSYKEKLFFCLRKVRNDEEYLTLDEKQTVIKRIEKVELFETFISYFDDILSIFNSKGFGFWECEPFEKEIDLSNISFELEDDSSKKIFKPCKESTLKNIVEFVIDDNTKASLSVWLQITKDTRDSDNTSRYLKVQLENTSTKFKEDSSHYFSIVTEKVNKLSFFGVEIKVNSKFLIPYKRNSKSLAQSDENVRMQYLYRNIEDYAIGHICSADWGKTPDGSFFVKTVFIPTCDTPDVEAIPRDKNKWIETENKDSLIPQPYLKNTKCIEFKWLSTFSKASNEDIRCQLIEFVNTYALWIESLNDEGSVIARLNIVDCQNDYIRMKSNIEFLLKDDQNMESFRIMNSAMFMQLWHGKYAGDIQTEDTIYDINFYKTLDDDVFQVGQPATWRPFQLAFILLNLDGIIQRDDDLLWDKRNEVVDLVWFPTGGGKTEAYLGIIAMTIVHRRRTKDPETSGGTTAIMRYTLRLLATQQFQRAMRMIFALDLLRRWNIFNLGSEIISIGLFVGKDSLPNSEKDLIEETEKWFRKEDSKIPIIKCPWCSGELSYTDKGSIDHGVIVKGKEIVYWCKNLKCPFSECLPVMLCDEYIYKYPPTLLFGTVDKFAALAHNVSSKKDEKKKDSRRLFGIGEDLRNLTPDLIIQDELHLLLGPLGSAVALFEAAIDQLCTRDEVINGKSIRIRPKVISSTATTRNTPLQIRALYDRHVNTFPKNGVDYDDSYFAFFKRHSPYGSNPIESFQFDSKRKYIGILPTGRTQMTTQLRLAATLFVHRALFEKNNIEFINTPSFIKAADYYYSIVSYFNSLKEVGKTDAQFFTEFIKYTRRLFRRVLRPSDLLECFYTYETAYSKCELTGRLSGSEVVEQLARVETKWDPIKRLPHKVKEEDGYESGVLPPDFIVATNMISVGLDVSRFNTIIMNSMPRNIAEYIQASSRVARDDLGLVITLHNPFRTRDLSHFEKFREFHEKMYCYVEPISITPFSNKAVERFLPLYLATIIRHKVRTLSNRASAGILDDDIAKNLEIELLRYFEERKDRTIELEGIESNLFSEEALDFLKHFIEISFDEWKTKKMQSITEGENLVYSGAEFTFNHSKERNLFVALDAYENIENGKNWKVPQSLRTVEPEAVINIID